MLLTTIILLLSKLQGSVDMEDFLTAVHSIEDEIPWTWTFDIKHYCLVNDSPYRIRFAFEKGETARYIECWKPWRVSSWMCEEVENTCDNFDIQFE